MVPICATNRDQYSQYIREHLAFFRFICISSPAPTTPPGCRARPVTDVAALCCLVDTQPPCPDHAAGGSPRPHRTPLPRPRCHRPSCPAPPSPMPRPAPTTPPSPLPLPRPRRRRLYPDARRAPTPTTPHLSLWSGPARPPSSPCFFCTYIDVLFLVICICMSIGMCVYLFICLFLDFLFFAFL